MLAQAPARRSSRRRKHRATSCSRRTTSLLAVREGVPRGYALIVGIARYKNLDESKQLRFPETDADAMYRVLINHEGGAFPAENVKFLKGEQATLANIKYHLEEWLPKVAQPMDRVVVYFAGHGFVQNGKGYLAPWDVDPDKLETTRVFDGHASAMCWPTRLARTGRCC